MGLRRRLNTAQDRAHPPARKPAVRRLALCIVVAVLATLVVAPASAHAISMTKAEKKVLALVNHARATHGLHKLKMVRSLERASRAHSREMVSSNYFSHNSYDGESFAARLIRFGYTTSGCTSWTVGENIAFGYGPGGTPKAIFEAWMHSAPHRAVIYNKRFRNVGVGRAKGTFRGISGMVFFTLDCGARSR